MKITKYFLPFIPPYFPLRATCIKCDLETCFSGLMWIRTNERRFFSYEYQCQDCGKLTFSDQISDKGNIVSIDRKCDCGGQFRRDKNIFCPFCKHRKSKNNRSESFLFISNNVMRDIEHQHNKT